MACAMTFKFLSGPSSSDTPSLTWHSDVAFFFFLYGLVEFILFFIFLSYVLFIYLFY